MNCDFCNVDNPTWEYSCKDFEIPQVGWGSKGAWAACDACHDLIEQADKKGLAIRSLDAADLLPAPFRDEILFALEAMQEGFWTWKGPAKKIESPDRASGM